MTTWFSSDTHYGHRKIIEYSNRPFANVDEMDATLIANWNSRVKDEDTVYHLGDFSFRDKRQTLAILRQLKGQKHLILGNHDEVIIENRAEFENPDAFLSIQTYLEIDTEVKHNKRQARLILCHYPLITWHWSGGGTFMVHGHCHGNLRYPFKGRILDAGVDPQGYYPISATDVVQRLGKVEPHRLDHHGSNKEM